MTAANQKAVQEAANHRYFEGVRDRALAGLIASTTTTELLPPKTTLFRFGSSPTRGDGGSGFAVLTAASTGCWWTRGEHIYAMKAASIQGDTHFAHVARHGQAVKYEWSNMDFFVTVELKVALAAYQGRGLDMTETLPDGRTLKLAADPTILQLFIPGLHEAENVRAWLRITDIQHLPGGSRLPRR